MSQPESESPTTYNPPVSNLLTYGAIQDWKTWPNYLELGLTSEHVPDLIRMALDKRLNWELTDENNSEIWAPIHAVRALGQLRAEEAIEPLLALFHEFEEDVGGGGDWIDSELAQTYVLIGTASIPAITRYFHDETRGMFSRISAMISLQ